MRALYFLISLLAARRVKKGFKNTDKGYDYEFEEARTGWLPTEIYLDEEGELSEIFEGGFIEDSAADAFEVDEWYNPGLLFMSLFYPTFAIKISKTEFNSRIFEITVCLFKIIFKLISKAMTVF